MTIATMPQSRTWLQLQNPALELANAIAGTDFVPQQLRNNPAAITAAILYGDEVGLGPMQSLAKIAVINGRPTLAAEAQRALILADGHDLWIEETTVTRCTICGRRRGSEATSRITWTLDDAKRAGLSGKPPWRMYPRQMLLARASAELARAVFPDAIGGLAATEEFDDDPALAPITNGVVTEPATPPTRRRRANVTQPATSGRPDPTPTPTPELPPLPGEEPDPSAAADEPAPPEAEPQQPLEASEPLPGEDGEDETAGDEPDQRAPTTAQIRKLNLLVGQLREQGHVHTEQLWQAIANMRKRPDREQFIAELKGRDDFDTLHWTPLRDQITRSEARRLLDGLTSLQNRVQALDE